MASEALGHHLGGANQAPRNSTHMSTLQPGKELIQCLTPHAWPNKFASPLSRLEWQPTRTPPYRASVVTVLGKWPWARCAASMLATSCNIDRQPSDSSLNKERYS